MTQKEIAELLNISRSTVSLALAGSPKVKQETREKICKIIKKTNYQPNMAARSLVMQKTNLIGVLIPSFAHRFLGELSDEIFTCLNQKLYSVIFGIASGHEEYSGLIDSMLSRQVDGIISYSTNHPKLIRLNENGLPIVVYRQASDYPFNFVDVNRFKGGQMLTRHLLETGRRSIAFIGEITNRSGGKGKRFAGCQSVLLEENISFKKSLLVNLCGEMKEGIEGIKILLSQANGVLPDAVIFHNDAMAIGGIRELMRSGLRVPEDIAVVGFDDIDEAQYCLPGLTTIRQPKKQIAEKLVEMLLARINKKNDIDNYIFEPEIVIRESSLPRYSPEEFNHKTKGYLS